MNEGLNIVTVREKIETGQYEQAFKDLQLLKNQVVEGGIFNNLWFRLFISDLMAEICEKENRESDYFYYKNLSMVLELAKEIVKNPPFFDAVETKIIQVYKGEHFYQRDQVFQNSINRIFFLNAKYGKYLLRVIVEILFPFLIPEPCRLNFFSMKSDYDKKAEIIQSGCIIKCQRFLNSMDVLKTVSGITALYGHHFNKVIHENQD
ncbi:hypothetical protein C7S20_19245 [Christiangramia fulva]|uniref:Uncharacterized protein n=1 Tax=Christiangramia fulva TaxID=2126553 RepID=A0A2R3ZAG6_9FLAO|nr:hypothetical protein [Christiangramia fulva]AVR47214.1 hypothetical protein C7S20_19245 [Christiangramia fulva]